MSELKPCPFCGSEVQDDERGEKYPKKSPMGGWIIHCECCGASLSQFRKSGKDEISWNTRPIEDALRARIAELEADRRWIPVSERLPKENAPVLVLTVLGGMFVDFIHGKSVVTGNPDFYELDIEDVTHWMPLPKLPEVQE